MAASRKGVIALKRQQPVGEPDSKALVRELARLADKANHNNAKAGDIAAVRAFFDRNPDIIRSIVGLAGQVQKALLEKVVAGEGNRELIRRECLAMRGDLGWDSACAIERLLIERVVMCWLRLQHAEDYSARLMGPGHSLNEIELVDKLLTRAHGRYLRAIESLARLRKLLAQTRP